MNEYMSWSMDRTGVLKDMNYHIQHIEAVCQNGRYFPDDIFKYSFLNENVSISINLSLKSVPKGRIDTIPTLVQIMAWQQLGNQPLSEPVMIILLMHTRPQWLNFWSSIAS